MIVSTSSHDHHSYGLPPCPCHTCNLRPANERRNLVVCIQDAYKWMESAVRSTFETSLAGKSYVQYIFDFVIESGTSHHPTQLKHLINWRPMQNAVQDAYSWLASNYRPGDQIYLFGFSSAAYDIRALAGMIYEVGLIRESTKRHIAKAYQLYQLNRSKPSAQSRNDASQFKQNNCWMNARVHFIGVWDTLPSTKRKGDRAPLISSPVHACHFRHALSLDAYQSRASEYLQGNPHSNAKDSDDLDLDTHDVKEVWFAGAPLHMGHFLDREEGTSFLWMHREASEKGLVLEQIHPDSLPDDSYFRPRRILLGYVPRFLQLRRVLPGQSVHGSVLLEMKYERSNALIGGIPRVEGSNTSVDGGKWESVLFSDELIKQLVSASPEQNPIPYPRKLLYVLQFEHGKKYVSQVPGFQETLKKTLQEYLEHSEKWGVKEFATCFAYWVAFHEGKMDSDVPYPDLMDREWILRVLDQTLEKHANASNVFIFPPLIHDEVLRKKFLTPEHVKAVIQHLDGEIKISYEENSFGRWPEAIADLAECGHHLEVVIRELKIKHPWSSRSRLAWMLRMEDKRDLVAALRVIQALSRTPQGTKLCSTVKSKLSELANKRGDIGMLAAEALLSLHVTEEMQYGTDLEKVQFCSNLREQKIQTALLTAANQWNMVNNQDFHLANGGHRIFESLYPQTQDHLGDAQKKLLCTLLSSAKERDKNKRTTATVTLLRLCDTNATIRAWLCDEGILDTFVEQLTNRSCSLLAAYALLVYFKYDDMKTVIDNKPHVPGYLVNMVRKDGFNDWLGQIEGYQILGKFMRDGKLRDRFMEQNMLQVLEDKLCTGQHKHVWKTLAYPQSNLLRCFENDDYWTKKLASRSLEKMRHKAWSTQKVGVAVFAALALTESGVDAIKGHIGDIVKTLLDVTTGRSGDTRLCDFLGLACALRVLSEDKILCKHVRDLDQFNEWKQAYLPHKDEYRSDYLYDVLPCAAFGKHETYGNKAPWHVKSPTLGDVQHILNEAISAIEEEFSDDGLPPVPEILPPRVRHWRRPAIMTTFITTFIIYAPIVCAVGTIVVTCDIGYRIVYGGMVCLKRISRHFDHKDQDQGEVENVGDDSVPEPAELAATSA